MPNLPLPIPTLSWFVKLALGYAAASTVRLVAANRAAVERHASEHGTGHPDAAIAALDAALTAALAKAA